MADIATSVTNTLCMSRPSGCCEVTLALTMKDKLHGKYTWVGPVSYTLPTRGTLHHMKPFGKLTDGRVALNSTEKRSAAIVTANHPQLHLMDL